MNTQLRSDVSNSSNDNLHGVCVRALAQEVVGVEMQAVGWYGGLTPPGPQVEKEHGRVETLT